MKLINLNLLLLLALLVLRRIIRFFGKVDG